VIFWDEEFPDPTMFDDTSGMDSGIPGIFVFMFIVVAVLGVGSFFWKIGMARDLATKSGLDPDDATALTMLTENGLEATYLASHLGDRRTTDADAPDKPVRTTEERLAELGALRDSGAITEAEYAERRRAIIDSI